MADLSLSGCDICSTVQPWGIHGAPSAVAECAGNSIISLALITTEAGQEAGGFP